MSANTHQMRSLAYVVREGSVSAAARRMGVSQSAVSQHIGKLEARVGAPLLVRGPDGVALTPVGQEIFQLADDFAALDQQIDERLRGHADVERGQLTIIANAPQPALSMIARYTDAYPLVSVDFKLLDWAAAMDRARTKQVDIAIITDPTDHTDLYVRPIKRTRYVCYVRADHMLASRSEVALTDIVEQTLLLPERGSLTRRVVTKALAKADVSPRRIVTMTTFPVMKEAILQGIGVGIFLEASSVKDDKLRELPITDIRQSYFTCVIVPKHKVALRITQSFLSLVDEMFGQFTQN